MKKSEKKKITKQVKENRKKTNKKYRSTLKGKIITRFYKFFNYSTKKKGVDESNFHLTPEQYKAFFSKMEEKRQQRAEQRQQFKDQKGSH